MHFIVYFLINDKKPGSSNNVGKNFNNTCMLPIVPADILKKSSKLLVGCTSRPTWNAFWVLVHWYTRNPRSDRIFNENTSTYVYYIEYLIDKSDPSSRRSLQIVGDEISIAYDTKKNAFIFFISWQHLKLTDRFNKLD